MDNVIGGFSYVDILWLVITLLLLPIIYMYMENTTLRVEAEETSGIVNDIDSLIDRLSESLSEYRGTIAAQKITIANLTEQLAELGEAVEICLEDLSVESLYELEVVFDDLVGYYGCRGDGDESHDTDDDFVDALPEGICGLLPDNAQPDAYDAHCAPEECPPECEYCKIAEQTKTPDTNGITEEI